MYRLTRLV